MLKYKNMPILASGAVERKEAGVTVRIGEPKIIAAHDESPDEGTFVAPKLRRFGDAIYLNWSFDWDVCDANQPAGPNGRVSRDGGITWEKQTVQMPSPASLYQTDGEQISAWSRHAFEVLGQPGVYQVPRWISPDLGASWFRDGASRVEYPGTKGFDLYDPPEEFRNRDGNYLRGGVKPIAPDYLEKYFEEFSRLRPLVSSGLDPQATGPDGEIYSMVYARYLRDTSGIADWDKDYWRKLNWSRYAVLLQISCDNGRTWDFGGVPVDGSDYQPRIVLHHDDGAPPTVEHLPEDRLLPGCKARVDFAPGDGFSEPSLVVFPDGEMLCALRTGGNKPLYAIRSFDKGRTWTRAELLSPNYVFPICGVLPRLVLLKNGILALATGRPHCTIHFSKDRGRTWFLSEILFAVTGIRWEEVYSGSHCNNAMIAIDDHTLLYVHDATRPDPSASHSWLRKAGCPLIVARRIEVNV